MTKIKNVKNVFTSLLQLTDWSLCCGIRGRRRRGYGRVVRRRVAGSGDARTRLGAGAQLLGVDVGRRERYVAEGRAAAGGGGRAARATARCRRVAGDPACPGAHRQRALPMRGDRAPPRRRSPTQLAHHSPRRRYVRHLRRRRHLSLRPVSYFSHETRRLI